MRAIFCIGYIPIVLISNWDVELSSLPTKSRIKYENNTGVTEL